MNFFSDLSSFPGTTSQFPKYQLAAQLGKCSSQCHPVLFNWRPKPVSEPEASKLPEIVAVSSREFDGVLHLEQVLIDARNFNVDHRQIPKQAQIKFESKLISYEVT